MRIAMRVISGAATTVVVVALLALVAMAVLVVGGYKPEVVRSGSMSPMLERGYLIVVKPQPPTVLKKGDVITFQNPLKGPGELVTHRIHKVIDTPSGPSFKTKGDANKNPDPWTVRIEKQAGLYQFKIPYAGHLSFLVRDVRGYAILLALPLLLLAFIFLKKVWTTPPPVPAGG